MADREPEHESKDRWGLLSGQNGRCLFGSVGCGSLTTPALLASELSGRTTLYKLPQSKGLTPYGIRRSMIAERSFLIAGCIFTPPLGVMCLRPLRCHVPARVVVSADRSGDAPLGAADE